MYIVAVTLYKRQIEIVFNNAVLSSVYSKEISSIYSTLSYLWTQDCLIVRVQLRELHFCYKITVVAVTDSAVCLQSTRLRTGCNLPIAPTTTVSKVLLFLLLLMRDYAISDIHLNFNLSSVSLSVLYNLQRICYTFTLKRWQGFKKMPDERQTIEAFDLHRYDWQIKDRRNHEIII